MTSELDNVIAFCLFVPSTDKNFMLYRNQCIPVMLC